MYIFLDHTAICSSVQMCVQVQQTLNQSNYDAGGYLIISISAPKPNVKSGPSQ